MAVNDGLRAWAVFFHLSRLSRCFSVSAFHIGCLDTFVLETELMSAGPPHLMYLQFAKKPVVKTETKSWREVYEALGA
jgi:hypothetical protein